jgi:hypothetical protein
MKKLLFAFMAVSLFACNSDDSAPADPNNGNPENPNPAECTNVYTGNVWLKNQAEVDAFAANGYCKIVGELAIGSAPESALSDITDISELESLQSVTKRIIVINSPGLASINGLQNIKNATEFLIQRTGITNLIGCPDFVEGAQVMLSAPNKISLEGFVPKNYMSFSLYGDADLEHFALYPNVHILKQVMLQGFKGETLEGLENIKKIAGLNVRYSVNLISLKGLENVTNLTYLTVGKNPELISLEHLSGVTSIDLIPEIHDSFSNPSSIDISSNDKLQSLHGLENVVSFGVFFMTFVNNPLLSDFCPIRPCLQNKPDTNWNTFNNKFNPTKQNVIAGNCSQP